MKYYVDGNGFSISPVAIASVAPLAGGLVSSVTTLRKGALTISGNTVAGATVVTTETHGLASGDVIVISGSDSIPTLDGEHVVTAINGTTFSIPVGVTNAGTRGDVFVNRIAVPVAAAPGRALVVVQADSANSAAVWLGGAGVTADTTSTGGYKLAAGTSVTLPLDAENPIYGVSTAVSQRVATLEISA